MGARSFVAIITPVVVAIGVAALQTFVKEAIAIKIVVIAFAVDRTTFLGHKLLVELVAELELRGMTFLCPLLVLASTFSLWFRFYARQHPVRGVIENFKHGDPC